LRDERGGNRVGAEHSDVAEWESRVVSCDQCAALKNDLDLTVQEDEELGAEVAPAGQRAASGNLDLSREPRHPAELLLGQTAKERNLCELGLSKRASEHGDPPSVWRAGEARLSAVHMTCGSTAGDATTTA
jgi:hypothetical protein